MKYTSHPSTVAAGFSLVEMAVVLVILAILITAIGVPLGTQLDQQRAVDTQKQLETIKEAIYGFAMANGRLPCPATTGAASAVSSPAISGVCTQPVGFVPAVTLGLASPDPGGFAIDGWNDGNVLRRLRYAVSTANASALTTTDGIRTATMATVSATAQLYVCATGLTAPPPSTDCGTMTVLSDRAPFVLISLGKDPTTDGTPPPYDAINNQNGDIVFSNGTQTSTFDDIVTWGSLNTLFARMVQAGRLP